MACKKFYPADKNDPRIWANKIRTILEEREMTQQMLVNATGLPATTISEWIGKNKKSDTGFREPGINKFHALAKALGVSMDYLFGDNECKTPDDEKIYDVTGLSDLSIKQLKYTRSEAQRKNLELKKKMAVLNCLIENMDKTDLLENLYDYLLAEYVFKRDGKEELLGAQAIFSRAPDGTLSRELIFADAFGKAVLASTQEEIVRLKKIIEKQKKPKARYEYEQWEKEHYEEQMTALGEAEERAMREEE